MTASSRATHRSRWRAFAAWLLLGLLPFAAARAEDPPKGKATLVWISMDGFRSDYLDRGAHPFFKRLMAEGAYSRRFLPSFPPITFPSHCCQATGVGVERHGISANNVYDSVTKKSYRFPDDSTLLQAEPIWLTAPRQGVRTLVYDWPLSQAEHGPLHADYFNEKFDNAPSDAQRLNKLLDAWSNDFAALADQPPLRLLMGYVHLTDVIGHQEGPDSPQIAEAVGALDADLGAFQTRAVALWKQHAGPDDRLYFLLTTDHGMSKVDHQVNLDKMLGVSPGQTDVIIQTVGNTANVFLDGLPASPEREARLAAMTEKLRAWPIVRVFRRETLPKAWSYAHPTRTGDLVALLPKGYTFNRGSPTPVSDGGNPKGMHGYPVEENPEMEGITLVWRYPSLIGGKDLGVVRWDQFHPTAANWLGIQPAPGAEGKLIALPGDPPVK